MALNAVHVQTADRQLSGGYCPFAEFGCDYLGNMSDLRLHIRDTHIEHLTVLCNEVAKMRPVCRELFEQTESEEHKVDFLAYRIRTLDVIFSSQLIWRIDGVSNAVAEAREEVKLSIFSPPFYTGKQGYKLAASIAFNGDGEAKGKFVSVFITILRGEHDNLLPWPFAHNVTLTLLDQRPALNKRHNVEHTVQPNTCKENRPYLGQPKGERNPRFGVQKFLEIKEFLGSNFVKEDAVFLRVNVDQDHVTKI